MKAIMQMLLNRVMSYLCGRIWEIAQKWVQFYEGKDLNLTGEEKRGKVAAMIREEAIGLGLAMADSLIYFAIEAAIQFIRAKRE